MCMYIYIYSYYNADSNGDYNTNQNSHDNTNIYIYIHNAHSKTYNNTNQHSNKHHIITPMDIIMPMKIRDRPLRHEVWRRSSPEGFVMGIPLYSMGDLQDPKMEVR